MTEDDRGFTLVEMVITMMVISIAVVALVGALAGMITFTSEHRGHAAVEQTARSYGETVQSVAQSSTALAGDINSGTTSVTVDSAALLPAVWPSSGASETYVVVDQEVMRVKSINRSTGGLTVDRGVNADAASHKKDAPVVPLLRCPYAEQLQPDTAMFTLAAGTAARISAIEYARADGTWTSTRSTCLSDFASVPVCDTTPVTILAECGRGLFRATIDVTTPGDARLRGVTAKTVVLLRAGAAT